MTRARSVSPNTTPSKRRESLSRAQERTHPNGSHRAGRTVGPVRISFVHQSSPKDCIIWSKTQAGEAVASLIEFCATHDRIAGWVKSSILQNEGLGKRADTIDFWIWVAEVCQFSLGSRLPSHLLFRNAARLNNFASMTAIVAALTSAMITRLHLTWAHVGRGAQLQPLARLNEPTANFSAYRALHQATNAPCVPFIAVFLTDIVHIQDQMRDVVSFPLATASDTTDSNARKHTNCAGDDARAHSGLDQFRKRLKVVRCGQHYRPVSKRRLTNLAKTQQS